MGKKLGRHTEKEFDLALERFSATGKPRILPFFMNVRADRDVLDFQDKVRHNLVIGEQYTQLYNTIDAALNQLQFELNNFVVHAAVKPDAEERMKQAREEIAERIQRAREKIGRLKQETPTRENIAETGLQYAELARLVQTYQVEPDALLEYMRYLWKQHMYTDAVHIGQWLENYYRLEPPHDAAVLARLKRQLGDSYDENNQKQIGETYYREASSVRGDGKKNRRSAGLRLDAVL